MKTTATRSRIPTLLVGVAILFYVSALVLMGHDAFGADPASVASGFVPPAEKIEPPYTNETCLKDCHGLAGFAASGIDGALRDLSVASEAYVFSTHGQKGVECIDCHQGADPNEHPRAGYADVDCRACHSKAVPADTYPEAALEKLAERGIQPPPEESRNAEGWNTTVHGKAWAEGKHDAPFCNDCHSAHTIRKSEDPASTAHADNLSATCGACHADQVTTGDVGGFLARLRISAHGKGDLSETHAVGACLSCHQGQAAHGEETVTGQACPSCHRVPEEEGQGATTLSSFHIKPHAAQQPLAGALAWVYRVGFWAGVAGLGALVTVLGFCHVFRKEEDGG